MQKVPTVIHLTYIYSFSHEFVVKVSLIMAQSSFNLDCWPLYVD